MPSPQYRYWLLTIPENDWSPSDVLQKEVKYCKGQLEVGNETGYRHWQVVYHTQVMTYTRLKKILPSSAHIMHTRSEAAEQYVWKEETKVEGSEFEKGKKSTKRNSSADWEEIRTLAQSGNLDNIPADIYVRSYSNLKRIKLDHEKPTQRGKVDVHLYLGPSGTGKSYAAWANMGTEDTYTKIPTTKWWDGYRGETKVIMDEFRGQVSIALLLRWLDPAGYPLTLETKGGGAVAKFTKIILTSNLPPEEWYPDLDYATLQALKRRLTIIEFNEVYNKDL